MVKSLVSVVCEQGRTADPSAALGGCDFFGALFRINRFVAWMRL
jgi:hypothetical protein